MTGRGLKESGKAYNGTLADTKEMLSSMPYDTKRIEKITERSQGNLKGEVLNNIVETKNISKGK